MHSCRSAVCRYGIHQVQLHLDTATSHDVMGLFKLAAKKFQQTIILITHDHDIAQLADRIVHIEDGKIVKDGVDYAET